MSTAAGRPPAPGARAARGPARGSQGAALPRTHEGRLQAEGRRFAIIASRWNDQVVGKLLDGALRALAQAGAAHDDIEIYRCPGAFEIPGLVGRVVGTGRFQGIICLGAVIRGATPHFDLVVNQSAAGVARIAAKGKVAVGYGVLACDNLEQALERAGHGSDNRGFDAAAVAIGMADVYAQIAEPAHPKRPKRGK